MNNIFLINRPNPPNNIFNFINAVFQIDKSENTLTNIDNELIESTLV